MNLTQLEQQHADAKTFAMSQQDKFTALAAAEGRKLTAGEAGVINQAIERANQLGDQIARAHSDANRRAAFDAMSASLSPHASSNGGGGRGGSLGQQFVNDPRHQDFIRSRGHHSSSPWSGPDIELMASTLTEGPASGGALVLPHALPGILETPTRELTVADLFAQGQTDSNSIEFMRELVFTNAAAGVLEGVAKPESALTFEKGASPTRKIAHWIPVTTEILDDQPMVASYVDRRLRHGIELKLDDALLNGSGVDPELLGILGLTGLAAAVARGADSNADAVAKQIAAIETATLLPVDAIVMHPTNWLAIQLAKTAAGEYISGAGPIGAPAPKMLWGRRVAVTPVIAVGTALVGSFKGAAQLFFRGGIVVKASNSHASFFVENKVALLAEVRANLVTFRNAAFGKVTGLSA